MLSVIKAEEVDWFGPVDCQQYEIYSSKDKVAAFTQHQWHRGFIMGIKTMDPVTFRDILVETDYEILDKDMREYCVIHPDKNIADFSINYLSVNFMKANANNLDTEKILEKLQEILKN